MRRRPASKQVVEVRKEGRGRYHVKLPKNLKLASERPNMVNHPAHYQTKSGKMEVIDVIEAFELGFSDGNTVKYILRAGKKGSKLEDLKKARWYLERLIKNVEEEK